MISEKIRQSRKAILDQIEVVSQNCKGCKLKRSDTDRYCLSSCSVGAEIKALGDKLSGFKSKGKAILDKGDEMTKSEVAYLVTIGISKSDIRKAMGVTYDEYLEVMKGWGLLDKRDKKKKVTA